MELELLIFQGNTQHEQTYTSLMCVTPITRNVLFHYLCTV